MRESRKSEKTHLPADAYEKWLQSQKAKPTGTAHRKAAENAYETWVSKRVRQRRAKS
jgi:hypothetical protein